jgi:prepilin-type N-terminal cleavage/methylation domain-containing protein
MNAKKAMTLMEIIMVIVLIGILSSIGIVNYRDTLLRAREREAQSMLRLIKHAEEVVRLENGAFVRCEDNNDCNADLRLDIPNPATPTWNYNVTLTVADGSAMCAQAVPDRAITGLRSWSIRRNVAVGGIDQADPVQGGCP